LSYSFLFAQHDDSLELSEAFCALYSVNMHLGEGEIQNNM